MQTGATVYTVGDFIRRVVDSLLRGNYQGKFLCSRCLIKLTKDNLDKSYTKFDIAQALDDVLKIPGAITYLPTAVCALCTRRKMPCLGVPRP